MKEYIMTLCIACLSCGVIGLLFDESDEISKYVKLVLSLCIIGTVFLPAAELISGSGSYQRIIPDLSDTFTDDYKSTYAQYVAENVEKELRQKISDSILQRFGIIPEDIGIELHRIENGDTTELSISKIRLVLSEVPDGIEEYVSKISGIYPDISVSGTSE